MVIMVEGIPHFERRNYEVKFSQDLDDLHGNSKKSLLRSDMILCTPQKRTHCAPDQSNLALMYVRQLYS